MLIIKITYMLNHYRSGLHALTINLAYMLDCCKFNLYVVVIESFQKILSTSVYLIYIC